MRPGIFNIIRPMSVTSVRSYSRTGSLLPQQADLLERYRGLVALGRIQYDEEQIRVVMQLRRLQKELADYAPPAIPSHLLLPSLSGDLKSAGSAELRNWWSHSQDESQVAQDTTALTRVKGHTEELASLTTPKGIFLTGPPGSGKSFLIDLWFSALPTPYKARKHYHELVLEIYRAVWVETQRRMASIYSAKSVNQPERSWNRTIRDRWRELLKKGLLPILWTHIPAFSSHLQMNDPTIAFVVAKRLLLHHWLLVFDKVQLLDVSSATLLADVLSWYWRMGGVIVGTSNKVPDDLYKNGVQRVRLEPFVEALKVRCPVITMRSEKDWRRVRGSDTSDRSWFKPGSEKEFEQKVSEFSEGAPDARDKQLLVFGRNLRVPWSSGGVCKFTFSELCEESLGPPDYLTLASNYHTVAITVIPTLKLSMKNQARRFISLIDALYEARCRIVCLAEVEPEDLFFPDAPTILDDSQVQIDPLMAESVTETQNVYRPNISSYNSPKTAQAPAVPFAALPLDTLSIFSGQDEQFAFKRALSRLLEMTSAGYSREELWSPLPQNSRQWESSVSIPIEVPKSYHKDHTSEADNFATEAAYTGRGLRWKRPKAPRFKTDHIWGVKDTEGDSDRK